VLKLIIDQDFNHNILRALRRRVPDLDAVTAHDAGLASATDPELLAWAAEVGRVLVTHDRKTMPAHASRRMKNGERVSGVFVVPRQLPIQNAINDLEIIVSCSDKSDWESIVRYLPL
jgi:hypothetical protein